MLLAARERPAGLDAPDIEAHPLQALSRRGTRELLAARMTSAASAEVADALHRATGGNPLALVELSRNAADVTLRAVGGLAPLPVCEAIRTSFARRLSALSAAARTALVIAATSQRDDMRLLVEAASDAGSFLDAYLEAEVAGAIELAEGRLRFQNPLLGLGPGITHTELKLTARGPVFVEVNARLGGDLIPYLGMLATVGLDGGRPGDAGRSPDVLHHETRLDCERRSGARSPGLRSAL